MDRRSPVVRSDTHNADETPEVAFIVPVFNQASRIFDNLLSLTRSATLRFELVVVNDASTDNTHDEVLRALDSIPNATSLCTKITYLKSEHSLFETKCDSLGFEYSSAPQVIEVQADMKVHDVGFDRRFREIHSQNSDIFMISGRGVEKILPVLRSYLKTAGSDRSSGRSVGEHLLRRIAYQFSRKIIRRTREANRAPEGPRRILSRDEIQPTLDLFRESGTAGRIGDLIELADFLPQQSIPIYVGETAMRGPISVLRTDYIKTGGLDWQSFFQGYDEHDLILRAWQNLGKRSAYSPVLFESPLEFGTTRAPRSLSSEASIFWNLCRIQIKRKKSALATYSAGSTPYPEPEIRFLEI